MPCNIFLHFFFIFPPVCKLQRVCSYTSIIVGNCCNTCETSADIILVLLDISGVFLGHKYETEIASILKMLCVYCRSLPWVAFHVASSNWHASCIQRVWSRTWQRHQPAGQTGATKILEKPRQLSHPVGHRPGYVWQALICSLLRLSRHE